MIQYILLIGFILLSMKVAYDLIISKITHTLIIRNPKNTNNYTQLIRCKERYHKDGSKWWHSFPIPIIKIPAPPDRVIDTTTGGKKWAEGYEIQKDQFVWVKDTGIDLNNQDIRPTGQKVINSLEPFDVTERSVLLHEFEKSINEKGKSLLSAEFILPFTALLLLGIIIIGGLIFVPDGLKSLTSLQNANVKQSEINLETTRLLFNITGKDISSCLGHTPVETEIPVQVQEGDIPLINKYFG